MRIDQYNVTVKVDDVDLGTWDKLDGGEVDSDETTYKPGGMGARISLGGAQNVGNVTVTVHYDLARFQPVIHWLLGRAGKGLATITKQPLDVDGNVFGRPLVYSGVVKMVTPPHHDSTASDAAELALEMVPVGTVA